MNTHSSQNDTAMTGLDGAVELTHWALMQAVGADAATFLQGQLTNDVSHLGDTDVRLAGFCSAKGRLQASFMVWKAPTGGLFLACAAPLLAPTRKRLSMFVLRAKCQLLEAGSDHRLVGVAGGPARSLIGELAVWQQRADAEHTVLRLPDAAGVARCMLLRPASAAVLGLPALPLDAWRWLEVQSGIATIEPETVDRFVPQMLNFELVGGVDFQKGCYPGQEVVARSQYRGTLKRRTFLFDADVPMAAGQEVFHSADPGQPAGLVANAAPHPSQAGSSALVELKLTALDGGSLHLGAPDGPLLRRAALPYEVPVDAAALAG